MTPRFELHAMARSGPSYAVGLMLMLCREPFDYRHVDLYKGEHRAPAYMEKNRFGVVPTLIDRTDGHSYVQSASILQYLAEVLGKFGGGDAKQRAEAREWLFWCWDRLAPNLYRSRGMRLGFRQFSFDTAHMYFNEGSSALKFLDEQLAGREWLVGSGMTVADIGLYGVIAFASIGGFDVSQLPNVLGWMKRIEAQPGFAAPQNCLPGESKLVAAA
ncbi:MAG: glutathione S-transferase family protein [Beijerinckiaceae bacterium]|nr:glutathione S-transferase family protein [Beijerinckiaceae bacterium]